jgi:hypothetical protein
MSRTEECITPETSPSRVVLRWMVTTSTSTWVLTVATVLAVALCGDLPVALLCVHAPLSLLAGACAVLAAARPAWSETALRGGHRALGLLCVAVFAAFVFSRGDWVHSLWSIQFPLIGLMFGSGLILVQVWPEDRRAQPTLLRGWNGATIAFVTTAALGATPLLLTVLPFDVRQLAREGGLLLATFAEVARYGFGGEVPVSMEPMDSPHSIGGAFGGNEQAARDLGIPPRIVTVTMASSLLAAVQWTLFAALALVGRTIQFGRRRRAFFLIAPLLLALACISTMLLDSGANMDRALYKAIWKNEPWLVKAYGPTLLVAAVTAVVLFFAVRRDGRAE